MSTTDSNLASLSRAAAPRTSAPAVPRPRSRWKTRALLPLAILITGAGLLAYAARSALLPSVDVWVVPVVSAPRASRPANSPGAVEPAPSAAGAVIAQAPGWIEADPYAVSVPALVEGVIQDVLVLEGQRVEAGQVVARLVDTDARLAAQLADAELLERRADVERAKSALQAALSRVDEVRDEVQRKRELVALGGVSEGQFARLEIRLQGAEREGYAARAAVTVAEAAVSTHMIFCEQARLALERTEIRSPSAGVVMARLVEPGSRVSMSSRPGEGAGAMAGAIVRLYDPAKLQVRVDVPLADVAKIGVGTRAHITTEALPDTTFNGTVTRVLHEANIQRNTVQVKVAIENPVPTLKPELLTRVRFYPAQNAPAAGTPAPLHASTSDAGSRLLVPIAALIDPRAPRPRVWLIDQSSSTKGLIATLREIDLAPAAPGAPRGYAEVSGALHAGDRLVIDAPPTLKEGSRVRILGERAEPDSAQGDR